MKRTSRFSRRFCVLSASASAFCIAASAFAGNTWTGGGASGNWSDNNNWGGAQPGYGTLTFSGSTRTTNSDDNITSMNQLLWTGTSPWTLNQGGSTVLSLFDNGGTQAKIENQSTGLVTINLPITFAANNGSPPNPFGEINAVNGDLTFGGGTLTVSGSSVNGIKFFGGGHTVTFNNTVNASNSTNGGAGNKWFGITTSGTGNTIAIGGTFNSGDFYVENGGALKILSGGTINSTAIRLGGDFGNTGNQDQTKGGTLQLASTTGGQTFGSIINSVTGNTSGALLIDSQNTSGTNTITGNIFLDSGLRIQQATGGTLAITNATLDLKAQTLLLNTGAAGNTSELGNINITGVIGNSTGSGQLVIGTNGIANSSGTVTLSNANTYSGDTFVRNGTLAFSGSGNLTASTIRLGSSSGTSVDATVALTGATGGVNLTTTINPVTTSGSGTTMIASQSTSGINTLSGHIGLDRNLTISQQAGGTLNITQARSGTSTTTGTDIKGFTLILSGVGGTSGNPAGTINYSGDIYNSVNSGSVNIGGGGTTTGTTVNLSGNNTYSGNTNLQTSSLLNIASANAIGTSALVVAGNGSFDNTTGGPLTLTNAFTLNGGSPTFVGSNALTISGAATISGANRTITVTANTLTLSGSIGQDASSRGLTKAGNGTLVMSGSSANTYTGLTTVSGGELDLSKTAGVNAIAGDGNPATNDVTVSGGSLKWLANEQVGDTATITLSSGTVNLNGQTETLGSFTNSGGTFTTGVGGKLIGTTHTIMWSGGGTNTINADGLVQDTHVVITGGTNVVQGLAGTPAGTSRGGILDIQSGSTGLEMTGANLTLNSDATSPVDGSITSGGPGKLLVEGSVISHASATTSTITSGGNATNPGVVDLNNGTRSFTVEDGAAAIDMSISAQVRNGGVDKEGPGVLALTGNNSYAGGTTVGGGTLLANNVAGSATGTGGVSVINSGSTIGGNGTISGPITMSSSGTFVAPGAAAGPGSIAALHVGALTMVAGSTLSIDLGPGGASSGAGGGTVYDQLISAGTVALNGATLAVTDLASSLAVGNKYFIVENSTANPNVYGAFASGATVTDNNGDTFAINYADNGDGGMTANDISLTVLTVVPEASTWVMGALALSSLLMTQRRRLERALKPKS